MLQKEKNQSNDLFQLVLLFVVLALTIATVCAAMASATQIAKEADCMYNKDGNAIMVGQYYVIEGSKPEQ